MPPRIVEVHRASSELRREGERAEFEIECSSGTYVRSLIATSATPTARSCGAPRSGRSRSRRRPRGRRAGARATPSRRLRRPRLAEFAADEHQGHQLPDAEPRPRRVAIGTFDGVHVGHRAVIEGADTVLTFEPHPLSVDPPRGGAEADHAVRDQARRDRGTRRAGAGRDPVRQGVPAIEAEEFCRRDPGRAARRRAGLGR